MEDLQDIAARVTEAEGGVGALVIERMDVKAHLATMHIRARSVETVDAFRHALDEDPGLEARAGAAPRAVVGTISRSGETLELDISLPLVAPIGVAQLAKHTMIPALLMSRYLAEETVSLTSADSERRKTLSGGSTRLVSQRFRAAPTALDRLSRALARIDSEPGLVITEVHWQQVATGRDDAGKVRSGFEISFLASR